MLQRRKLYPTTDTIFFSLQRGSKGEFGFNIPLITFYFKVPHNHTDLEHDAHYKSDQQIFL